MKLLLAEDNPFIAREAHAHLAENGHEVVIASNAEQAAASFLASEPPMVVILGGSAEMIAPVAKICADREATLRPYVILRLSGTFADRALSLAAPDANDVLVAPLVLRELAHRVVSGARFVENRTAGS